MPILNEPPVRQPQQCMAAPVVAAISDTCHDAARDQLLASIDLFQDWIGGECGFCESVTSEYEARRPERLQAALTPVVLHAALVATQRGDAQGVLEAMKVIVARYLKEHDGALLRIAGELATEGC
jgi:hypothetical protein